MNKNMITVLLAAILMLTGCELRKNLPEDVKNEQTQQNHETEENKPAVDYASYYQPVLDSFFHMASGHYEDDSIPEGGLGLREANGWNENPSMLWDAGYMIRDLSGDGVPELLIGSTTGEEYEAAAGTMIYALFTIADNQVQLTLEGFYRNAYCLLEDGSIFNHGSGGAAHRVFGLYDLTEDGTALACRDYWFTYEKDGNYEDIRCWHNTTGERNPDVSEELDMTYDEFWEKEEELAKQRKVLDLITFAEYGGVEKPACAENPTISAVFANDYTGAYDSYVVNDAEYAANVVFTTDSAVRDFRILKLTLEEITDDGYVSFSFDELYAYGTLTPEKGLAVRMNLPETIPFYGISYTDGTGAVRIFSVNLSGFDGSVYLAEIGGAG